MKLINLVKILLFGEELIENINSPVNGKLTVFRDLFGRYQVRTGSVTASGPLVDSIMLSALKHSKRFITKTPRSILLLGLGAGSIIKILHQLWPEIKITAVEYDQTMIMLGRKYFDLSDVNSLQLIEADAIDYVVKLGKKANKFDLILVDLQMAIDFPDQKASQDIFITNLKYLMTENGLLIINRLNWGYHKQRNKAYIDTYQPYFRKVYQKKVKTNLLIYCKSN